MSKTCGRLFENLNLVCRDAESYKLSSSPANIRVNGYWENELFLFSVEEVTLSQSLVRTLMRTGNNK